MLWYLHEFFLLKYLIQGYTFINMLSSTILSGGQNVNSLHTDSIYCQETLLHENE